MLQWVSFQLRRRADLAFGSQLASSWSTACSTASTSNSQGPGEGLALKFWFIHALTWLAPEFPTCFDPLAALEVPLFCSRASLTSSRAHGPATFWLVVDQLWAPVARSGAFASYYTTSSQDGFPKMVYMEHMGFLALFLQGCRFCHGDLKQKFSATTSIADFTYDESCNT